MAVFLTRQEELDLAVAWQRDGDEAAMHHVIMAHLPLIHKIVTPYLRFGYSREDLVQAGTLGAIRAINKFDTARGTRFSTCASLWISAEIQDHIRRNHSIVRECRHARPPLRDLRRNDVSLDKPISESSHTLGDSLVAEPVDSDAAMDLERRTQWLMEAMERLDPRERRIIERRHLQDERATLEGVGAEMNICKERVRQIEDRGMKKLRSALLAREGA